MENNVLTTQEAAQVLGLAVTTLCKYRCFGGGPRYLKIGKKSVRYRMSDLTTWLDRLEACSTSDYTKRSMKNG